MRPTGCAPLSPREEAVVELLLRGMNTAGIAECLRLTPNTVKDYIKSIYRNAEVHSSRELMVKFLARAAPDLDDPKIRHLTRMLTATGTAELHAAALAGLRAWTGARRAVYWELRGDSLHPRVAEETFGSSAQPIAAVLSKGTAVMSAQAVGRDRFMQAAAGARPFIGEVLLGRLKLGERSWLIALADAPHGVFDQAAQKLAAGLLRIAQRQAEALARIGPKGVAPVATVLERERWFSRDISSSPVVFAYHARPDNLSALHSMRAAAAL